VNEATDVQPGPGPALTRTWKAERSLTPPAVVWLLGRALLGAIAVAAPGLLTPIRAPGNPILLPSTDPLAHFPGLFSVWFRFDAGRYVDIAQHGYRYGAPSGTNTNWFPLYPLLIRLVTPITGGSPWIAALVVSNLAFLAALILLWRWSLLRWPPAVSMRVLLLICVFPFAFFFAAPYSESLFLALAVAVFLFAEVERWPLAVASAGLATVTRPVGVALVVALVLFALSRGRWKEAVVALAAFLPFLGFMAYLGIAVGHPLAFTYPITNGWVPPHGGILATIESQFHTHLSPFDRVDALVAAIALISGVFTWRKLGPGYGAYVLLGVLLPLTREIASMERYVIVLFPMFSLWASWENRAGQAVIFSFSLFGLFIATTMFAVGYSIF
jgi:hypothetical protein